MLKRLDLMELQINLGIMFVGIQSLKAKSPEGQPPDA